MAVPHNRDSKRTEDEEQNGWSKTRFGRGGALGNEMEQLIGGGCFYRHRHGLLLLLKSGPATRWRQVFAQMRIERGFLWCFIE